MSAPRRHSLLVLAICSLMPSGAPGQQTPPPSPASPDSNLPPPNWVKLYSREQVITGPTLIESATSLQSECKGRKRDGKVAFSLVVDSAGLPRNVIFERALANEIDLLGLNWMLNATFKPAMFQDAPVAMGQRVEMRLQACAEEKKDQSGKYSADLRLRFPPEEKFEDWQHSPAQANLAPIPMPPGIQAEQKPAGNNFTPPKFLIHPPPPDANGHSGSFSLLVRIDEHGIPHIQQTLKSTDPQLLSAVMQCIRNFRHQPALNDGMPVPAIVTDGLDIKSGP